MANMTPSQEVFGSTTAHRNAMLYLCDVRARPWPDRESWDERVEKILLDKAYLSVGLDMVTRLTPTGDLELDLYIKQMRALGGKGLQAQQRKMLRFLAEGNTFSREGRSANDLRVVWSLRIRDLVDGDRDDNFTINQLGVDALAKIDAKSKPKPVPKADDVTGEVEDHCEPASLTLDKAQARVKELLDKGYTNIRCTVKFKATEPAKEVELTIE